MYYYDFQVVLQEVPGEISLCFSISGCDKHCEGCHSPFLWKKVARGLSAGRVQSVAIRLIVEREREIKAFNPQEYWSIETDFVKKDNRTIIVFNQLIKPINN